jgi:hypothetical protein
MQGSDLEELETLEMVVTGIYGRSAKTFILVVVDGLEARDTQALSFYLEFYAQYVQLVNTYSTARLAIVLVKNIGSAVFGEQQLVTKNFNAFVIPAPDDAIVNKLSKKTEGQDTIVNFEILYVYLFISFLISLYN